MRQFPLIPSRRVLFSSLVSLELFFAVAERRALAQTATLQGDPAHPAVTSHWVETRLYFGLGPIGPSRAGVTHAAWRRFLDQEVTPRFPSGLSVGDLYGQWQGRAERHPYRLRSKVIILIYEATQENATRIDDIRIAWKRRTGDQSVLKVTEAADVSF